MIARSSRRSLPIRQLPRRPTVKNASCLRRQLEEKAKLSNTYLERLMRMQAEFENYRKRVERERQDHVRFASENIVRSLVDVAENLERALAAAESTEEADEDLVNGVRMTLDQLKDVLDREGLAAIEAVGKPFDPRYHEAVARVPSEAHPENVVVREYMKGYVLNSKVLRPAKVEVSAGKQEKT